MKKEFLTDLGLDEEICEQIMREYDDERLEEELRRSLEKERVSDISAALLLIDGSELTYENMNERIAELKEKHPSVFESNAPKIVSKAGDAAFASDEFQKMGYRERLELYRRKPELYKKLVK